MKLAVMPAVGAGSVKDELLAGIESRFANVETVAAWADRYLAHAIKMYYCVKRISLRNAQE